MLLFFVILHINNFYGMGSFADRFKRIVKESNLTPEQEAKYQSFKKKGYRVPSKRLIKSESDIQGIRASGVINTGVLDYVAERIKAGVSTAEIDKWVYDYTTEHGAIPAPLNYEGFPKSVCVSINHVVCHGIPSEDTILKEGDIVNVDVSTIYNGYYSDASRMFIIGKTDAGRERLVKVAKEALEEGLKAARAWHFLGDIGAAVQQHVEGNGFSVVRDFGGHGVGIKFHEDPFVSHVGKKNTGMVLVPGMVFTIEPMVNMGRYQIEIDEKDGWTVTTIDKKPSAQWEYTVLITEEGPEILTY